MSLLTLPAELRLRIYSHLSDFQPGRFEDVTPHVPLTPTICRASRLLREETLPLYAQNSHFTIQTDASREFDCASHWVTALGALGLANVRSFQISRHWELSQPTRWQGHVGFYIKLEWPRSAQQDEVQCTAGTYPIAKDMRGMRLESVELLQSLIRQNVITPLMSHDSKGLTRGKVEYLVNAMRVVASHPISAFDTEQSEAGRKRRREKWAEMERQLLALPIDPGMEGYVSLTDGPRSFFTPY